jgi:hypothetical protein
MFHIPAVFITQHACMQGNCKSEPSAAVLGLTGPELTSRTLGQCVLVTDVRLMVVLHSMWLDNLYIRHRSSTRTDVTSLLACYARDCNLWLTSVTLQGDWAEYLRMGGVEVSGGQLFAKGVQADQLFTCMEFFRPTIFLGRQLDNQFVASGHC